MDISRAILIDGWMLEEQLVWLAGQASRCRVVVEVGSWMGRSTRAMADNTRGVVYAVDTWRGSPTEPLHLEAIASHGPGWLRGEFDRNMRGLRNVRPVQMHSLEAAGLFAERGKAIDMVFLDASHDYESVLADIRAWRPLLREGGIICGHDYEPGWPGVMRAVNELVPEAAVVAGAIWHARDRSPVRAPAESAIDSYSI